MINIHKEKIEVARLKSTRDNKSKGTRIGLSLFYTSKLIEQIYQIFLNIVFSYIKDPPLKIALKIKTSIKNNKKRTDKIYVNILTHLILSLHALHHALNKKYAANPNIETTKTPKRIASRSEGSSSSSSSDSIASILALLSTTGKEAYEKFVNINNVKKIKNIFFIFFYSIIIFLSTLPSSYNLNTKPDF